MKKASWCTGLGVVMAAVLAGAGPLFFNFGPQLKVSPEGLRIALNPAGLGNEVYVYYRTPGMTAYQFRKLQRDSGGMLTVRLATDRLYGNSLEYYLVEKKNGVVFRTSPVYSQARLSDAAFPAMQEASPPAATPQPKEPWLRASASASSGGDFFQEYNEAAFPQNYTANGNFRLYRTPGSEGLQFEFDTNMAYLDPQTTNEKPFNLTSMVLRARKKGHKVEIGDIPLNHSEFTATGIVRRGLNYEFSNEAIYLNAFFTNSQEKKGFSGMGIPAGSSSILGAVAGFNLKSVFRMRGLIVSGRDDQSSMTTVFTGNTYRSGRVLSLLGECSLLKNQLMLRGEVSSSSFGSAERKDQIQKEADTAFQGSISYSSTLFLFSADYKKIGNKFNSIANLMLQNDREGGNGNLTFNLKVVTLTATYTDQKTYMHSELQPMQHQKRAGGAITVNVSEHLRLGAEYARDNLDYDAATGLQTGGTAMNTIDYAGTMGVVLGLSSLNLRLGKTESQTFTSNINGSVTLSLVLGSSMTIAPSFSYQDTTNFTDNSKAKTYNVFLNSEFLFVPNLFTVSTTGSWMKNDNTLTPSTTLTCGASLNIFLAKLFKDKVRPVVALKSRFQQATAQGIKATNFAFGLQGDLAF